MKITEHHPAYLSWEEFVKNQERLRQNWGHEGNQGVPREGSALLQGMVYCGVCGRKMSVQNRAAKDQRSPSYICGRGYQDGDEKICQSMTSRPVDAALVEAFLAAVSPMSVQVATRVLDQVEQDLIVHAGSGSCNWNKHATRSGWPSGSTMLLILRTVWWRRSWSGGGTKSWSV